MCLSLCLSVCSLISAQKPHGPFDGKSISCSKLLSNLTVYSLSKLLPLPRAVSRQISTWVASPFIRSLRAEPPCPAALPEPPPPPPHPCPVPAPPFLRPRLILCPGLTAPEHMTHALVGCLVIRCFCPLGECEPQSTGTFAVPSVRPPMTLKCPQLCLEHDNDS